MLARTPVGRAIVVVLLVSGWLVGCGGGGGDEAVDEVLLAAAIAEGMKGGEALFDDASASCIAEELVASVGVDRLGELGFSVESVPDQLHADWSEGEVDVVMGAIGGCVDVGELTRATVSGAVDEDGVECVLDSIGDDFFVVAMRAELSAGADDVAIAAAQDDANAPFNAAVESCAGESSSAGPEVGGEPDPSSLPAADSPGGLGDAVLPDTTDGVAGVFGALPEELLDGRRELLMTGPGQMMVLYALDDRGCLDVGLRSQDVSAVEGFYPDGWTAEHVVALFASGADWEVEAAGHEGGLFWVLWKTTCSGVGVAGVESVFSATWGEAGSPLVFFAGASDAVGREELIAAFVDAAAVEAAASDVPAVSAEQAAAASAVLTAGDLGSEWFRQPRMEQDDPVFDEMASGVMGREPACAKAVAWAAREGMTLKNFTDGLLPEPVATGESASLTYGPDSVSEVEHTVSVFGSAAVVTDSLRLAGELEWPGCLRAVFGDLMQSQFDAGGDGLSITEYSATEPPVVGDQGIRVRFELIVEVAEDGSTFANTIEFSVVGVGRAASALTVFSFDGAIDDKLDDIVAQAADKVTEQFDR